MKHLTWIALLVSACAVGAPPGFSSGTQWTFPLVDPLDDGVLVTPVMIKGKGPYLFAIDPDANAMVLDERVVVEAGLVVDKVGPRVIDETGAGQIRFFAEIRDLQIGSLTISERNALVVKHGTYYTQRREIDGVIGRSVLSDSLVFGFDRDRGIAVLSTQDAFKPPADAVQIHFEPLDARLNSDLTDRRGALGKANAIAGGDYMRPVPRKLATATIDRAKVTMHLDLGAVSSQLRDRAWPATLAAVDRETMLIDETGTTHVTTRAAVAAQVTAGGATATQVAVVPYVEKRWDDELVDGALGLDFFRDYSVWANWDKTTLYLVKRGAATSDTARMTRWGGALAACPHAGCVEARVIDPRGQAPVPEGAKDPGVVVTVTRDPAAMDSDLEVVLVAQNRPDLPRVIVELPRGVARVIDHVDGSFGGAQLAAIDLSPFGHQCPAGATGCLAVVAR